MVLTGFLFGNIDEHGRLENDFLDPESKRNLHQLNHLGIGSMWKEITEDAEADNSQDGHDDNDGENEKSTQGDEEYSEKLPSSVDYFDFEELADDDGDEKKESQPTSDAPVPSPDLAEESDTFEGAFQRMLYACQSQESDSESGAKPDDEEGFREGSQDSELMPPPPAPAPLPGSQLAEKSSKGTEDTKEQAEDDETSAARKRNLDTPLAAMLPSKYADLGCHRALPRVSAWPSAALFTTVWPREAIELATDLAGSS
ncbi:hypothetical protein MTO96_048270 [Rhipicephalus appendiculatus]